MQIANINQCALVHGAYMHKTICTGGMVDIYKCLDHVFKLFLVDILYTRKKSPKLKFGGNNKYKQIISIRRKAIWVFLSQGATVVNVES